MTFEERVEAGAKAMYEHGVKTARGAIDALRFDPTDISDFILEIRKNSETAQVILFFSFVDERVKNPIRMNLNHIDSNKADNR